MDPTPGTDITASQSWLELPAQRTDNPNAIECTIEYNGERNYTLYYDKSTYTSMWVAYPLEAKYMGSLSRPNDWSYNPMIATEYQVNLDSSYVGSTYSRGHLIPNASRNGIKGMQLQTFYYTNAVPQHQTRFNDGVWNNLEQAVQTIGKGETVYVTTGVAFAKKGESRSVSYIQSGSDTKSVPIPNYFYKVVLRVKTNSSGVVTSASTIAFWFENREYTDSFYDHATTVDEVEAWTGFDFFVNLPDSMEAEAEKNNSWSAFESF